MSHVRARQSFKIHFDPFSILIFHTAIVLTLMHSCKGQSEVIGPLQPVVALIGDDIILPSNLKPDTDAYGMTLEWARPDLDPRFVLVWRDGVYLESKKHPLYDRRTSLFTHELKNGNVSLKISKVKLSDEGTYRCFVPELMKDAKVQLVVGAASLPVAEMNRTSDGRMVLQCESAGWYPEPELLWLDSEGNLLSAEPTQTLRGPDDLYTVSSRLTVEKRHSNNFTCRVQQRNINQSRETYIHVPDDFFMVISPSSSPRNLYVIISLIISAAVVLILSLAVFFVWKKKRGESEHKKMSEEDGPERLREEKTSSKCDNTEFQIVAERGESEPLITGREVKTGQSESEGEKTIEAIKEGSDPQTSEFTEEHKEQPVLEREENSFDYILPTDQEPHREKDTQQERPTESDVDIKQPNAKTKRTKKKKKQEKKKKETRKAEEQKSQKENTIPTVSNNVPESTDLKMQQDITRGEIQKKQPEEISQNIQEKIKEQQLMGKEAKSLNSVPLSHTFQEPQREKETQQELVGETQTESDVEKKQLNVNKENVTKKNGQEKNVETDFIPQKKKQENQREQLEAERHSEENQRKLRSETRAEREKTKVNTQKDKHNKHGLKKNKTETNEAEPQDEKGKEGNRRDDRKAEPQRSEQQNTISPVSSKVRERIAVKIETENQEKKPEGESQKSPEEIREHPEKLRRAENKEGELQTKQQENINQKIIREESVSLSNRGVDCQEEPGEELMEVDQILHSDQKNIKRRKHKTDRELHQLHKLAFRRVKNQRESRAQIQKSSKVLKECLKKQNSDQIQVNNVAAIARLGQVSSKCHKDQQKLPVQEEPRGSNDYQMVDVEMCEEDQEESMDY